MSTESHNTGHEPRHTDVSFEERDIQAGVVYKYLFALGLAVVASLFVCVFILRYTTAFTASTDSPPPPSRETHQRELPPEPRLQGVPGHQSDPQADLRKKNQEDSEANEKLEWIDRSSGIVQIPVKDAMKIVAEKGLPAAPALPVEKKK
jgi:7-keto-8-aminopelargonate synthetase-like enzyme